MLTHLARMLVLVVILAPFAFASDVDAPSEEFVLEHDEPFEPIMSAQGDVIFVGDGDSQDVYIVLGDEGERHYELNVGALEQGIVELEVPVEWTQTVTVTTDENVTINLWNHNDTIPHSFLSDVREMEIVLEGEVISEVPIMNVPAGT